MPINSRSKGKRGELELAAFLKERGYNARRGRQFSGSPESPDVIGLTGFHLEVKRTEKGSLHQWLAQACAECGLAVPVVMHRRSRGEWIAILRAEDFLALLKK